MLSESELKSLDSIFQISCKSFTIPLVWNKGRLSLKPNQHRLSNSIVWLLIVSTIIYKIIKLPSLAEGNDIIGSTSQLYSFIGVLSNSIFRLNIALYKTELVELLNRTFYINSVWGKSYYFVFF